MILTIEAETAEELREKVLNLASVMGGGAVSPVTNGNGHDTAPDEGTAGSTEPVGKKRGRKPKDAATAETSPIEAPALGEKKDAPTETPAVAPTASEPTPNATTGPAATPSAKLTKDDVVKALTAVTSNKGMPAARELLLRYKATRLSEIKEEEFAAFINDCKIVAGG